MKTILVPTDFNVESLKIIDALVLTNKPDQIGIVFMHAFKLSDSITDMLMLSRRSRDHENISNEFYEKCDSYRLKYPDHIKFIGIEYFYGSTVVAFRNFIERIDASYIAYSKSQQFVPINKYSIDPNLLTQRCGCNVLELDVETLTKEENLFESKIPEELITVLTA